MKTDTQTGAFDFNQLCGIAISRLGLSAPAFYELSPSEYFEALHDHQQREKTILEMQTHTMWETTRMHIYHDQLCNPYIDKKNRPKRPSDVFKLPWEKESDTMQSVEEMKKVLFAIHENQKGKKPLEKKPKNKTVGRN